MAQHDWDVAEPAARLTARRSPDHDGAWQVAKRVVAAGSARGAEPRSLLHLQRIAGNGGVGALVEQEDGARSPVLDVIGKGGGSPLPAAVRDDMETGLGADFGSVRVHDGPAAAASAQSVQAKAYTVGDEIVFNRDAYQPDSEPGRHTLAHELTHVVQQRSGPVDGTATGDGVSVSDPGDRFERDAEASATALTTGNPAGPANAPTAQRHADEDAASVQEMPLQRQDEMEEEEPVQAMALQREGEEMEEEEAAM